MSDHVSGNDPGCGRHVVMDYGSAFFAVRDRGTECLGTRDCEAKMKDGCLRCLCKQGKVLDCIGKVKKLSQLGLQVANGVFMFDDVPCCHPTLRTAIRTKSSTNLFEYVNGPQSLQPSP